MGIHSMHPDDFVLARIDEAPGLVCAIVEGQALALRPSPRPPRASSLHGSPYRRSRVPRRESPIFSVQLSDWRPLGLLTSSLLTPTR